MCARSISPTPRSSTEPPVIPVIRSDAELVAVCKPAGMPVQPDPTGDPDLLSLLRAQIGAKELWLIHRIDRPVSGVVLFGRSPQAAEALSEQFRERTVQKQYWAIVEGRMATTMELQAVLRRDPSKHKAVLAASGKGAPGRLHVSPLRMGERYTLVEVRPEGGAFHQIRAQLGAAGWPIKGDVKYGARRGEKDRSIHLHARSIKFTHPVTRMELHCEAAVPLSGLWPLFTGDAGPAAHGRGPEAT